MNYDLHALLGDPTIVNLARIGRSGHVTRMDESHPIRIRTRLDGGIGRKAGAQRGWRKQIQVDLRMICNLRNC